MVAEHVKPLVIDEFLREFVHTFILSHLFVIRVLVTIFEELQGIHKRLVDSCCCV